MNAAQQLLFDALTIAQDHLAQYRRYSEEMRAIGRGCSLSSAFQPETADTIIAHAINAAKAVAPTRKAAPIVARLADMTDAQRFAEYKATAPGLDLRFTMAHMTVRMTADGAWADEAHALCRQTWPDGRLRDISRPEFYQRLRNLQDDWRRASNRRDTLPIGSPAWREGILAEQDAQDARMVALADSEVA